MDLILEIVTRGNYLKKVSLCSIDNINDSIDLFYYTLSSNVDVLEKIHPILDLSEVHVSFTFEVPAIDCLLFVSI